MERYNSSINDEFMKTQNALRKAEQDKQIVIDVIAIGSKLWVECTKLRPWEKASLKIGIDVLAELLKSIPLSDAEQIRTAAKRFNLDKVVAVPFGSWKGKDIVIIRAYGRRAEEFINHLGLHSIPEKKKDDFINNILENEKNFGVVIYQK